MPYCYACRNHKPATHGHFTDYGALALRPPKRHISETAALWERLSDAERDQAQRDGRAILASDPRGAEGATRPARRSAGPAHGRIASTPARTDTRAASSTPSPSPRRPGRSAGDGDQLDADQLDGQDAPPLPGWAYALAGVGAVLWLVVSVKRGRPIWPAQGV